MLTDALTLLHPRQQSRCSQRANRAQQVALTRRLMHTAAAARSVTSETAASPEQTAEAAHLHLDAGGADVLRLLRLHFDGCDDMRLIAMYGSGAFVQLTSDLPAANSAATTTTAVSGEGGAAATAAAVVAPTTVATAAAVGEDTMLDLIFAVDDPMAFHTRNMQRNPAHYSFLRHLAVWPSMLERIQEYGAGVWYNTLVRLPVPPANGGGTKLVKYGVIGTQRLIDDLTRWESLYIAGRMHKPMHLLQCSTSIRAAADSNLRSALTTSLLLIDAQREANAKRDADQPATPAAPAAPVPAACEASPTAAVCSTPLRTLLGTIASLSYMGDIRMGVAENPNKVANIVRGSWREFLELYRSPLQRTVGEKAVLARKPDDPVEFSCDVKRRGELLASLPANYQSHILRLAQHASSGEAVAPLPSASPLPSSSAPWVAVASRPGPARHRLLTGALGDIVRQSSQQQTMKGLATAGVRKSLLYGLAKVKKAMRR